MIIVMGLELAVKCLQTFHVTNIDMFNNSISQPQSLKHAEFHSHRMKSNLIRMGLVFMVG